MALSPDEVARLAQLARIDLSAEELVHLAPQLDVILEAVARVADVATAAVMPTSHPVPMTNVFRPDEVLESLPVDEARAMAPHREQDRFRLTRNHGEAQ